MSSPFVSEICSGSKVPSDRTISDICREFDVDERWLRTGEGEMFRQRSRNEVLVDWLGTVLRDEPALQHRLLSIMSRIRSEEWAMLSALAERLLDEYRQEQKNTGPK